MIRGWRQALLASNPKRDHFRLRRKKLMMNLLILDQRAKEYEKALKPKFPELSIHAAMKEEEIGDFIENMHILLTFRISDELIKKALKLQWIQSMATGVDYIVNLPSVRKEVLLTSSRGIHGPQMSEMAFLLMLALNRNFPQVVRNQDKRVWERWPAKLLYQKKVGILGIGVIGEEIAEKAKAFGIIDTYSGPPAVFGNRQRVVADVASKCGM